MFPTGRMPARGWLSSMGLALAAGVCLPGNAMAQAGSVLNDDAAAIGTFEVIQIALFAGITGAALLSALFMSRERNRAAAENDKLRNRVAELTGALQRSEALLDLGNQRVLVWFGDDKRPEMAGSLASEGGVPEDRSTFLAFGKWLAPRSAAALERAIARLRDDRRGFELAVETHRGVPLEVEGRASASHCVVRFLALSALRRENAELKLDHQRLHEAHGTIRNLLDALSMPVWSREANGQLNWVNRAYAQAVEASDPEDAVAHGRELMGTTAREALARAHLSHASVSDRLSTVVGGDRKVFCVTEYAAEQGSAGMAADISEIEQVREDYARMVRAHSETLDQLNSAVAIFDARQKLRFFNQAFRTLWQLDASFLDSAPDHALLLDRLRSEGRLAEQPEWRRWKENLLSAYRAVEPQEHWWHLPDGQTIRVIANPQPDGGATWIFENLTEKINLESRYNSAVRVQGETLDNLAEGVAVFGPDGRVRLSNPAFASLWSLPADLAAQGTHISAIRAACKDLAQDNPWGDFVAAVTGFDEERRNGHGKVELEDGAVLRYAIIHLPNGQVMITFVDVTDSVNVERALKEKNEALQRADQLKNDFVQHVSYELRSPLTNIIGFTELLSQEMPGPLMPLQREYVDHIGSSSAILLTIVNDILDLATVDAGIMKLEIGEVLVENAVRAAATLISERLAEHNIKLSLDVAQAPLSFQADENRVRQVLFNLLSNAANYAPDGSTITLACRASAEGLEFTVHDDGPGMPPEALDSIFRRFESRANGGRRRGAGLGLSIVKSFVELHGGTVGIDTGRDRGTTVTCRFPLAPEGFRVAAE